MPKEKSSINKAYNKIADGNSTEVNSPIPAATVVLLREQQGKVEILMLQKNTNIDFGGMWVFPGGAIDEEDYEADGDRNTAAINAAVRETEEEAGLKLDSEGFVWFSHWTPPPTAPVRFTTWFFAAEAHPDAVIQVDGEEILKHRWINPAEALTLFESKEIKIAPPTWMTLTLLNRFETAKATLDHFKSTKPRIIALR